MNLLWNLPLGLTLGFVIGMTGTGGGALLLPLLIGVFKMDPLTAVGTGLIFSVVTRLTAVIIHFRMKTVRLRRSIFVLLGSLPSVLISAKILHDLSGKHSSDLIHSYLENAIGIILMVTAGLMIFQIRFLKDEQRNHAIEESRNQPVPAPKKISAVLGGVLVGILTGTTSVGGGVLIVPLFMGLLDASCVQAVGSSIFISLLLSASGGLVYLYYGHIVVSNTSLLCLASVPGVIFGSRLSGKIPEVLLVSVVAALLILGGIGLLV